MTSFVSPNPFHRLVRWGWLRLTGEDPVVVSRYLRDLEHLNGLHVEFLIQLECRHPDLKPELDAHRQARFAALNPYFK